MCILYIFPSASLIDWSVLLRSNNMFRARYELKFFVLLRRNFANKELSTMPEDVSTGEGKRI
jgi:hypothetical protein